MRAVLFDFGGTLDSDGLTWGDRFFPIYREAGLTLSREAFDRAFYKSDDNLPTRFALAGKALPETLQLQVSCVLEEAAPDRRDLTQAIAGRFLDESRAAFARNKPVLERLARRYKLGIVSNFYGNLTEILAAEGLAGYFGVVADSQNVGHIKPSKEIFQYAMSALGTSPADTVMVGDSIKRDMKGAEDLGMPHILVSPKEVSCCSRGWRVSVLAELERRLT
jgi:putative hydrolase of the HAD superfamily